MSVANDIFPDGTRQDATKQLASLLLSFFEAQERVYGREMFETALTRALRDHTHRRIQSELKDLYPNWPKSDHKIPTVTGKEEPDD